MNTRILGALIVIVAVSAVAGVLIFNNINPKTMGISNPIILDNQMGNITPSNNNTDDSSNYLLALIPYSWRYNNQHYPSPSPTPSPTPDPMDHIISLFDAYLKSTFNQSLTPGMAVVIVKNDKIIYLNTLGVKDMASGANVAKDTLFEINSNTKPFAGANIAQYVSSGLMSWDDKISEYFNESEFKLYDDNVTNNITIRDLLLMRSGLPKYSGDELATFNDNSFSDTLYKFRYYKNNTPFQSKFQYNNVLYSIPAYCAARANNESWDDMIKNDLLIPLGMTNAVTNLTDLINSPDHTKAYIHYLNGDLIETPLFSEDWDKPAGSISCSISEIANWLKFQIADTGYYNGVQIMNKSTLDETRTGQIDKGNGNKYGFGWSVGQDYITHSGASYASFSSMKIYLSKGLGIAIFANEAQYGTNYTLALTAKLDDLLNGIDNSDPWKKQDLTPITPSPPPCPLTAYIGVYSNGLFGNINVTQNNSNLVCYYGNSSQPYTLEYTSGSFNDFINARNFEFEDNSSGSYQQLHVEDLNNYTVHPFEEYSLFNRTNST